MDVQMPHCDGYKATQLIRKHKDPTIRNVLIIAMTASAIEGDREKCLASGMNNYLAKPVRAQTLKAMLESYLAKEEEDVPNLQQEAKMMVKDALAGAEKHSERQNGENDESIKKEKEKVGPSEHGERASRAELAKVDGVRRDTSRPRSSRTETAQRIVPEPQVNGQT